MADDYRSIPVLEEESSYISIEKNEKGYIYHTGSGTRESDFFYMWTFNAISEDEEQVYRETCNIAN